MSSYLGGLWSILSTYRPNAARDRRSGQGKPKFGAFVATYAPPSFGIKRPSTDREAQRMYNHIRTVAFWLDASPLLADLGLPFRAGLDDIISLIPLYGDIVSGILQLYQVWLCFVFGVPLNILGYMLLNVVLDVVVGIVPIIGDMLDNWFKSNLRNLALLETWLLTDRYAGKYHILLMPESQDFIPVSKSKHGRFGSFFGGNSKADDAPELRAREAEVLTGKVRKTRRMGKEEGLIGVSVPAGGVGGNARPDPVFEPVD